MMSSLRRSFAEVLEGGPCADKQPWIYRDELSALHLRDTPLL